MTATLRHCLATLAAFFALTIAVTAWAAQAPVFTGSTPGVAINGYDPVAYFTDAKPVAGDAAITAEWNGVTWQFASDANKNAFLSDPARYAPQYGGYCAWAVSKGYTAKTEPEAWSVVNGKLYLNYSTGVRSQWQQDTAGNITKGDANWPKVLE